MSKFVEMIMNNIDVSEAVAEELDRRASFVLENCDHARVVEDARLTEARSNRRSSVPLFENSEKHRGYANMHMTNAKNIGYGNPSYFKEMTSYHDHMAGASLIDGDDKAYKTHRKAAEASEMMHSGGLTEATMIPSKREAIVAFATAHYNKKHGTDFPKHDIHAHLYGGEAPEFAAHVETNAAPEAPDHLKSNFGLNRNSFMEGEGSVVEYQIAEMEDAPDNAIPALSKEAVKRLLATYKKQELPDGNTGVFDNPALPEDPSMWFSVGSK